jgi:hypothetical protein
MYYSCKGVRCGRLGEILSTAALSTGAFFGALSAVYPYAQRVFLCFAVVSIFAGVMLLARYCFTEYVYTLEEDTLTVTEKRGVRIRTCARLRLSEMDSAVLVRRKDFKRPKASAKVYDYRPCLLPHESAVITVTDPDLCEGRERIVILLSPDEKMLHLLGI